MRTPTASSLFTSKILPLLMVSMLPSAAFGLGLGDITLNSFLNQPLSAEVELLDVQDLTAEDIKVRLATQEAFDRLGVERAYFLTSINFEITIEDGLGRMCQAAHERG